MGKTNIQTKPEPIRTNFERFGEFRNCQFCQFLQLSLFYKNL